MPVRADKRQQPDGAGQATAKPLKITILNPGYDPDLADQHELLVKYTHLLGLANGLKRLGHDTEILQLSNVEARGGKDCVRWRLVNEGPPAPGSGTFLRESSNPRAIYLPTLGRATTQAIERSAPDILHISGCGIWRTFEQLRPFLRSVPYPITSTYHGPPPPRNPFHRWRARRALRPVGRFFFHSEAQAAPWLRRRIIAAGERISICVETSTHFQRLDQTTAKKRGGYAGQPIFVWAGRLDPWKDPMTALRGFELIRHRRPEARLYLAYTVDDMLPEIKRLIDDNMTLRNGVRILDNLPASDMEILLSAADFLIQPSRREVASRVVLEAMACGTIPVMTEIAAFQALSERGRYGLHFPAGDPRALAGAVLKLSDHQIPSMQDKVASKFAHDYSFGKIAQIHERAFHELLGHADLPNASAS